MSFVNSTQLQLKRPKQSLQHNYHALIRAFAQKLSTQVAPAGLIMISNSTRLITTTVKLITHSTQREFSGSLTETGAGWAGAAGFKSRIAFMNTGMTAVSAFALKSIACLLTAVRWVSPSHFSLGLLQVLRQQTTMKRAC